MSQRVKKDTLKYYSFVTFQRVFPGFNSSNYLQGRNSEKQEPLPTSDATFM